MPSNGLSKLTKKFRYNYNGQYTGFALGGSSETWLCFALTLNVYNGHLCAISVNG